MDEMMKTFSENFSRYLKMNGLNPNSYSKKYGIAYSTVSQWVRGISYPRQSKLEEIADSLGVQVEDLITKPVKKETYNYEEIQDFFSLNDRDKKLVLHLIRDMLNSY